MAADDANHSASIPNAHAVDVAARSVGVIALFEVCWLRKPQLGEGGEGGRTLGECARIATLMATESQALLEKLDRISEVEAAQRERLPRSFGPYVLLTSLAKGGMGEVFLAKSGAVAGFEKHCVVKTLRPHLTDDREYVARFIDEARVVVQLNHKSLCQVFDVGMVGERYYLAMELIAGTDLRSLADVDAVGDAPHPMDAALAVHITGEVLEALDYAHRFVDVGGTPLQLVHRDVSPQNVMISFEGEVKLIDFGLAASTVKVEQTSPNIVMGKLAYMAPEQIRGEKVDGRADLFAVAMMFAELCVGERYYAGKTAYEIWSIANTGTFRPRLFDTIDVGLRQIIDQALSASPNDRQASCMVLRQELMQWRQNQGLYADGPVLRAAMQAAFAPDIREHRDLLLGVSAPHLRPSARVPEPPRNFARSDPAPAVVAAAAAPLSTLPSKDPEDHLPLLRRPWPRRGLGLLAAMLGAYVVVVNVRSAALLTFSDSEVPAQVAPSAFVPVAPSIADPLTALLTSPIASSAASLGVSPVASVVETPLIDVSESAGAGVVKKPKRSARDQGASPKASPAAPSRRLPPTENVEWSELGIPAQVAALVLSCNQGCVADVHRRFPLWGKGSASQMKQFRLDVDACHQRCK